MLNTISYTNFVVVALISIPMYSCGLPPPTTMSREQCESNSVCTLRGLASAEIGEHGQIVRLELDDGSCVNVSLPPAQWAELRRSGATEMTVSGEVFFEPAPGNGEESIIEIDGRRIGFGLCGPLFIFVPEEA